MRTLLLLLAALVAVAFSAVFQQPMHKRSNLEEKFTRRNRYSSKHAAYKTGRGPQRDDTSEAASGSAPIIDYYEEYYLSNISIGTPAQTFTVMLDTGTSDLWVVDAACKSYICEGQPDYYDYEHTKNQYNTSASSTFRNTKVLIDLFYGEAGSNRGYIATDVVNVAGLSYAPQDILVCFMIADFYSKQPIDGVLGLAWPALAYSGTTQLMQNLLPQLDKPLFTIWLDRHVKLSQGVPGGLITYGGYDSVNCDDEISYVTLSSKTYWQFPINNFQLPGYSIGRTQQAMSDTGSSFLLAPPAAFSAIVKAIGAHYELFQGYQLPCAGTYPDLVFTIGSMQYNVPATEYVIDIDLGDGLCELALSPQQSGGGFAPDWVFGQTWIRTYCNVHDYGNARIGFAKAHHSEI